MNPLRLVHRFDQSVSTPRAPGQPGTAAGRQRERERERVLPIRPGPVLLRPANGWRQAGATGPTRTLQLQAGTDPEMTGEAGWVRVEATPVEPGTTNPPRAQGNAGNRVRVEVLAAEPGTTLYRITVQASSDARARRLVDLALERLAREAATGHAEAVMPADATQLPEAMAEVRADAAD